jgi:hypothetical protein
MHYDSLGSPIEYSDVTGNLLLYKLALRPLGQTAQYGRESDSGHLQKSPPDFEAARKGFLQRNHRPTSTGWRAFSSISTRLVTSPTRLQMTKKFDAPNNIKPSNGATKYVNPETGVSVVIDNKKGHVI